MPDFVFSELVAKRGLDPDEGRLVRHDVRGRQYWEHSRADFDHFASSQKPAKTPYRGTKVAFQFVAYGRTEALFVGAHRVLDQWLHRDDPSRMTRAHHPESVYKDMWPGREMYDLERIQEMDDLSGRVVIDWGPGTRSWSQWLNRRDKPIVELRAQVNAPRFPGFEDFEATIEHVPTLPIPWQEALASVSGVYLIVTSDGQQYVGSAYGAGGLLGRWLNYADNGHGGNQRLRNNPVFDATVRVLRIMDPSTPPDRVIAEEARWKHRLGSRAYGLNAN
jgi:hypothetical protein